MRVLERGKAVDRAGHTKKTIVPLQTCAPQQLCIDGDDDRAQRHEHGAGGRTAHEALPLAAYPGYDFTLTIGFSGDALAKQLAGVKIYDW
ncbi:MAG TPA: hypothetical protein VJO52_16395 [Gemmatimonadaceae bacterium]|nr:hypothetical protein [Gemmatimonadaceae bacterium]